jgi:hypothetical protein
MKKVLIAMFSVPSVPRLYKESQLPKSTRVEVGSNSFTVTLRVVGGDEKEVSSLRE